MSQGSSLPAYRSPYSDHHTVAHFSNPDPDDDDEQYLEALIAASTAVLVQEEAERKTRSRADVENNQDMVRFDKVSDAQGKAKGTGNLSLSQADVTPERKAGTATADIHLEKLEKGEVIDNRKTSVKQRREARSQTAGSGWFDLPAVPTIDKTSKKPGANDKSNWDSRQPTAQQMRQEITAIRLRNANDPKRFYKGNNGIKAADMPKFAQLGKIIGSNLEPASSLTRGERGRTVVEELVRDAEASAYAKRKFDELQDRKAGQRKGGHNKSSSRKKGRR